MSIRLSVKQKLIFSFIMVIIFLICFSIHKINERQKEIFYDNLVKNSRLIGKILISTSADFIIKKQYHQLEIFGWAITSEFPGIRYLLVLDENCQVLHSSDTEFSVKRFVDQFTRKAVVDKRANYRTALYKGERVFDIYVPLLIQDKLYGLIRLGFSMQELEHIRSSFIRFNIFIGLISIMIALIITLTYVSDILSPIKEFIKGTQKIAAGDFLYKIQVLSHDEFETLAHSFNKMSLALFKIRKLSSYLSRGTHDLIDDSCSSPFLGGSFRTNGIFFSDIRGFTTISEKYTAEEVVELLNSYFNFVTTEFNTFSGDIDKFIGDAIMAVFPVENSERETAFNMCAASLYLSSQAVVFSRELEHKHLPAVKIGIGLTLGIVIEGNIGAQDRMDYTVIGDTVNQASRLEGISKAGKYTKVMTTKHVMELASDFFEFEFYGEVDLKGKSEKVQVYELKDIKNSDVFIEKISTPDYDRALKILSASKKESVLQKMLALCRKADHKRVLHILTACENIMSNINADPYFEALMEIEKHFSNPHITSKVAKMLSVFSLKKVQPYFDYFMDSDDARIKANFVKAVGYFPELEIMEYLTRGSNSPHPRVQSEAFIHLFFRGDDIMLGLYRMLTSGDDSKIISSMFVLTQITAFASFRNALLHSLYYEEVTEKILSFISSLNTDIQILAIELTGTFRLSSAIIPLETLYETISQFEMKQKIAESLSKITA